MKNKLVNPSRVGAAVALAIASLCAQAQGPSTAAAPASAASAPAQGARPEVVSILQAARSLNGEKKYADALSKIREADALPGITPYERHYIERMRAAAAVGAGDAPLAIKSLETALQGGGTELGPAERQEVLRLLASLYYNTKQYPQTIEYAQRYFKEGGNDAGVHTAYVNAVYLGGDYATAAKELAAMVKADDAAGKPVSEQVLRMLASSQNKTKDDAGYTDTLRRLVARYPQPDLWADLIWRVQSEPGFGDNLRLDTYRLKMATGSMDQAAEYVEMAQLAMQAGFPAEAQRVLEEGYAKGKLGTGANAKQHQALRDQARKAAAADAPTLAQAAGAAGGREANSLNNMGFALVVAGQPDKGLPLMEQAAAKGGLKRPEEAKLHLGVAQFQAGQKEAAAKTFATVQGKDGSAELAKLWLLVAQGPQK